MNEKKTQYVVGGIMFLIGAVVVYAAISSMANNATNYGGVTDNTTTTTDTTSAVKTGPLSQDDASEPYRTLSYAAAVTELNKEDNFQAYYIGCRDCGYCVQLEGILKQFLAKHQDKNADRDLIHKIEAGYSCVPETSDSEYGNYVKIYDFLLANNAINDNEDKAFGTPQFILVKNGKIVDELDNYGRSVDGLEQLFAAQKYRGF